VDVVEGEACHLMRARCAKGRRLAALAAFVLVAGAWQARAVGSAVLTNVGMVALSAVRGGTRQVAAVAAARQAEQWFTRALSVDPGNLGAHRGLGWIREAQGDLSKAASEWDRGGFTAEEFLVCAQRSARVGRDDLAQLWRRRAEALQQVTSQSSPLTPVP